MEAEAIVSGAVCGPDAVEFVESGLGIGGEVIGGPEDCVPNVAGREDFGLPKMPSWLGS